MDLVRNLLATMNTPARRLGEFAPLVLRVVLGGTMAWHGYQKFTGGLSDVSAFFEYLSIPLPGFFAFVIATLELVGGLCVIAGFATRLLATLFVAQLTFALLRYKIGESVGFIGATEAGGELDLALIAGFIALAGSGAGRWSVDSALALDDATARTRARSDLTG